MKMLTLTAFVLLGLASAAHGQAAPGTPQTKLGAPARGTDFPACCDHCSPNACSGCDENTTGGSCASVKRLTAQCTVSGNISSCWPAKPGAPSGRPGDIKQR